MSSENVVQFTVDMIDVLIFLLPEVCLVFSIVLKMDLNNFMKKKKLVNFWL